MSVKHLCRYLRRSPPSPAAMTNNPGTFRKMFPGGLYFGGDFISSNRQSETELAGDHSSEQLMYSGRWFWARRSKLFREGLASFCPG